MTRHSYRERDYTFGQAMLKLRTSIGLTQAGLAALLGVSRRAVGEWEAGSNYPKAEHFKPFLGLCVQQHVFAPEREEESGLKVETTYKKLLVKTSERMPPGAD
jgi:transcriptional regulator with XRE-family HTH domain